MLRIPQIRLDNKPAKIHPRLHRNDAPSRQRPSHPQITKHRIRIRIIRVPARIMRVHSEIVSQAVREKRNAGPRGKDVLRHALQDPQPQQARDGHAVRVRMHVVPAHASPQHRDALLLHPQHDIVDGGALGAEGARDGERARDVRRVARDLGAGVEQQVQLARERLVVADVVQGRGGGAGGDDGVVGLVAGAALDAGFQEQRLEVALVGGGRHGPHDGGVGGGRDGVGVAD